MDISYVLLGAITCTFVLMQINQRLGSPVLAIISRWLRWLLFGFGAAYFCTYYGLIDRPFWVLVAVFLLVWFFGETLYNWLGIQALSVSPLPLFPRYVANQSGEEWPTQPRLLKMREWLRGQGFRPVQSLKAEVGPGIHLRVSVYQDHGGKIRVQITFLPQASGSMVVCCSLTSLTSAGDRYVTDNFFIPFAGFYPENWFVLRKPWCRSLKSLFALHRARLAKAKEEPVSFLSDPLIDLNSQQNELDQLNTELGFLHPQSDREELGKITHEGRYRVWKEIWLLNYLGRSVRYE